MNRSIYKTDYVPYNWMENNFDSNSEEFCSLENIDECLRYISQEFSALGYPSIYSSGNICPFAVNCDIVQLLNVTYELINNSKEHVKVKEELETRNQRLCSDLAVSNKKNAQLKENLEQAERKYSSAIEKERQLKEKNSQLLQQIKTEKEEYRKLTSQIVQQKVTYQHEARKYENSMSQMKSRLNQLLADKNPDKKIATVSPSNLLQRNSRQRGKWKTGSVAKSSLDEMYSSVISGYENRCQSMLKEMTELHSCFEYIQSQLLDIVSCFEDDVKCNRIYEDKTPLQVILNRSGAQQGLKETFRCLIVKIKDTVSKLTKGDGKEHNEIAFLKSKISQYEEMLKDLKSAKQVNENEKNSNDLGQRQNLGEAMDQRSLDSDVLKAQLEIERERLKRERMELAATISYIQREKSDLALQKLEVIKMRQLESPRSQWHQNLRTVPSFSVLTTKNGSIAVPSSSQLRSCLSSPHQENESLTPFWKSSNLAEQSEQKLKSEPTTRISSTSQYEIGSSDPSSSSLPKWATAAINSSSEEAPATPVTIVSNTVSNEDLDVLSVSGVEEQNLSLLHAAMKDIEDRRKKLST